MSENDHESWNQLLGAAKRAGSGQPPGPEGAAPPTVVSRLRELRKTLWVFARTVLWRRWSVFAIVVAALLYLLAYLLLKPDPEPSIQAPQPPTPLSP